VPIYFPAGKEQGVPNPANSLKTIEGHPLPFRPESRWAPFGFLAVGEEADGFVHSVGEVFELFDLEADAVAFGGHFLARF